MLREWTYGPEPEVGTYVRNETGDYRYCRHTDGWWYNIKDEEKITRLRWVNLATTYENLVEYLPPLVVGDRVITKEELDQLPTFTVLLYDEPVPMSAVPSLYKNRTSLVRAPNGGWVTVNTHTALGLSGSIYNSERLAEIGRNYSLRILSLPAVVSE